MFSSRFVRPLKHSWTMGLRSASFVFRFAKIGITAAVAGRSKCAPQAVLNNQ
jgi:hypothetical protein